MRQKYYSHFMNEETEAQEIIQLVDDDGVQTQVVCSLDPCSLFTPAKALNY